MYVDGLEKQLLKKLSKNLVMRKDEIIQFLLDKTDDPITAMKIITGNLIEKGLITCGYFGESCFAITQKGMKEVSKIN